MDHLHLQSILRNTAIPNYLRPLAFQKVLFVFSSLDNITAILTSSPQIRFLGGKLGEAIANEYDVSTVGDLL